MLNDTLIALTATLTMMSASLALAGGAEQTPEAPSAAAPAAATAAANPAPAVAPGVTPAPPAAGKSATQRKARERAGHGGFSRFAALNLSDQQKSQVDTIAKNFRAENKVLFASLADIRAKAREAKAANDQARLQALDAEGKGKRAELAKAQEARDRKIAAVLTPEQLKEWQSFKTERNKVQRQHASQTPKH